MSICEWCNTQYEPKRYKQKFCSYVCGYTAQNHKRKIGAASKPRAHEACLRCGASMAHKKLHAMYCSKTCKSMDHTFQHRGGTTIRRARRRKIIERDEAMCYMCGKQLALNEIELDHLIPVSRGGNSDASNVAVACMPCNRSRGNRIELMQLMKLAQLGVVA